MRLIRSLAKLTMHAVLGSTAFFVHKVKHKESHSLLAELKEIDRKVKKKIINIHGAKSEFMHTFHKLKNTLSRLKERGETFEAQHMYHVYERYAHAFNDEKLLKQLKTLHP